MRHDSPRITIHGNLSDDAIAALARLLLSAADSHADARDAKATLPTESPAGAGQ